VYHSEGFKYRFACDINNKLPATQSMWLFAHNAKYDIIATGLIHNLCRLGWLVSSFSDDNPCIIELKHDTTKRKLIILSTTNYFQCSLRELGATFDLQKLEPAFNDPLEECIIYCKRDVEIVKVAIIYLLDLLQSEDLCSFRRTIASLAFSSFRHKFMKHDIWVHTHKDVTAVERRAYAGGRNEAFFIGTTTEKIYYLDINSMYPYVMKQNTFPVKNLTFKKKVSICEVEQLLGNGYLMCADCDINTGVPIFHLKGEKLLFPTGEFQTSLSTPEIKEGVSRGIITKISNAAIYDGANIFSEYVQYFYMKRLEAKEQGNKVLNYFYKIMLNSLYGKFGQRAQQWEKINDANIDECCVESRNGIHNIKIFGGGEWKKTGEFEEAFDSFPAVAAHVTAYARMLLYTYVEKVGIENVFYCDTDSLFVNGQGYQNLLSDINPSELGKLKVENISDVTTIRGCKDYIFNDVAKLKGVSRNSINLRAMVNSGELKLTDIPVQFRKNLDNCFVSVRWNGMSKYIKKGRLDNYENDMFIKVLSRTYDKGTITGSGRVVPFILS